MKPKSQRLRLKYSSILALALLFSGSELVFYPNLANATVPSGQSKFKRAAHQVGKKMRAAATEARMKLKDAAAVMNDPAPANHPKFDSPDPYGHRAAHKAAQEAKRAKDHPHN